VSLRARIRHLCDDPGPGGDRCTEPEGHAGDFHANGEHRWAFRDAPAASQLPVLLPEWRRHGIAKDLTAWSPS
jgi:hypothetical protein